MKDLYLVREHSMELLFGQTEAFAVGAVHHQDDNLKDWGLSALLWPTLNFIYIKWVRLWTQSTRGGIKVYICTSVLQ